MSEQSKKIVKVSLPEVFYYIFFVLLLVAKCVGLYDGQTAFKLLLVLAVGAWAVKMYLTDYTVKELVWVLLLLGLGALVYLKSGEKGALLYIFMITGLKNVPIKRVFVIGATFWTIGFVIFTWVNALHLLDSPFKVHDKFSLGPVIRWGLGYSHPNVLHVSYLVLVMFLIYLLGEKYSWKSALGFMAGNILIFLYSLSSTGVIAVTFYLGLTICGRYRGKLNTLEKVLVQAVLPAVLLFSFVAPIILQGRAFELVNDLTNTRLNLARYFLTLQSPTLFGTRVANLVTSQLTMDNSYVNAFVTYGIILFGIIVVAYLVLIARCCKEQKKEELCVILACLVAGITEPFLFNTSFKNISLLFMGTLLFTGKAQNRIHFSRFSTRQFAPSVEKPVEKLCLVFTQMKEKRKLLVLAALIGCVLGCGGYQLLRQVPDRILVPESSCDVAILQRLGDELEAVTLATETDVTRSGDQAIGYVDEKVPMIVFDGNIVRLEHIRGLVCSGLTIGVMAAVLVLLVLILKNSRVKVALESGSQS